MSDNVDATVVDGFGDEWQRFDQSSLLESELRAMFEEYFAIFPWSSLPPRSVGFDLGCGSGRWAKFVAPRVGALHCIDPSGAALDVARRNLEGHANCHFHLAAVDKMPIADHSADFGYAIGVLHHVPDTALGLASCARKLKAGAPFLVYLYYAFDNRPPWYKVLHGLTEAGRSVISRMPYGLRYLTSQVIAAFVYFPFARLAFLFERLGVDTNHFPLSAYRRRSFYSMRTDALDRFGTRMEKRFTKEQIERLMRRAGFRDIRFHHGVPYWCAVGRRV